jgi:hypothetical protein
MIILRANPMFLLPLGSIVIEVLKTLSTLSTITQYDTVTHVLME